MAKLQFLAKFRASRAGQAVKLGIGGSLRTVKVSPGDDGRGYCSIVKGQGQIFGAVKGSSMKICWVKILTPVAGGSTGAYVVSHLAS